MEQKDQHYIKLGLTLFFSLAVTILFFFLVLRIDDIVSFLSVIFSALQPILIGMAIAYVLCPVQQMLERWLAKKRFARVLSVLFTMLLAFGIVLLFCALVLPELTASISDLAARLPGMINAQMKKLNEYLATDSEARAKVMELVASGQQYLQNWLKTDLLTTLSAITGGVVTFGAAVINLMVAVIVSIYLLLDRERYMAQCRKLFFAVSKNKNWNNAVLDAVHQTDRIFSGFISGKLLDSLIIGAICFAVLTLLRMPYTMLVSVIVGVTNIIPMFGPFIGAIPSALLILLVSPAKCLVFLIFIIILQQIDGNIIGPRILGNSIGLSALYVTVALLLFGKLLGFAGMIVGAPLFATLYYLVKRLAERSLRRQHMPTDTLAYIPAQEETKKKG